MNFKKTTSILVILLFAITLWGCKEKKASENNIPKNVKLSTGDNLKILKTYGKAYLGEINTSYGPVYIIEVSGTHYQMGYQYGKLVGSMIPGIWWTFINYLSSEAGQVERGINVSLGIINTLFGMILDEAWEKMEPYVPNEFKDEIRGINDAARDSGYINAYWVNGKYYSDTSVDFATMIKRVIAISNISDISGDLINMVKVIGSGYSEKLKEYYGITGETLSPAAEKIISQIKTQGLENLQIPSIFSHHCSFFTAYNYLTEDHHLIASRNLDWSNGSGIAKFKALTIWAPNNEIPHMTIGYIGFIGAIAGLNEEGIGLGEVGSGGILERLYGEPWVLKFREILEKAHDLDEAIKFVANNVGDGFNRPPTIGYNWMIAYGDPNSDGTNAGVANFENNGAFTGMYRRKPDCSVDAKLFEFNLDGKVFQILTHKDHPFLVNYEGQAVEIMVENSRYPGQVTEIPAPYMVPITKPLKFDTARGKWIYYPGGVSLVIGKPIKCAVYRGDEMMMNGMRMWQTASNGPWDYDNGKVIQNLQRLTSHGGSYRKRYMRMYHAIYAYSHGVTYAGTDDITGKEKIIVPDNNGKPIKIGLDEGANIASWAAMHCCNVISVAYDLTALRVKIAYETGTGDQWKNAADNEYHLFDFRELLNINSKW